MEMRWNEKVSQKRNRKRIQQTSRIIKKNRKNVNQNRNEQEKMINQKSLKN